MNVRRVSTTTFTSHWALNWSKLFSQKPLVSCASARPLLITDDVRKALAGFLSKLNLPESDQADVWKTKAIHQLILSLKEKRPVSDAASRNAIIRFEASLIKRYPELEAYDEDAFRAEGEDHEETSELFGFIDDV